MKTIAILLAVCVSGAYCSSFWDHLTDEQKSKLKSHKDICAAENDIDLALIHGVEKGEKEVSRSAKLDCFGACIMKKIGMMKDDGSLDIEVVKAKFASSKLDSDKSAAVLSKCKDLVGKDSCETAGNLIHCVLQDLNSKAN